MKDLLKRDSIFVAWAISIAAMLGSLYFSNIRNFPPCILCWYQRIFMYPLVLIIGVGIYKKDKNLPDYVLPLAGIGWLISVYHNLLYYNIIPESATPCINGVSCTTKFIEYFGFVTIPFLSFAAFTIIIATTLMYKKYLKSLTN